MSHLWQVQLLQLGSEAAGARKLCQLHHCRVLLLCRRFHVLDHRKDVSHCEPRRVERARSGLAHAFRRRSFLCAFLVHCLGVGERGEKRLDGPLLRRPEEKRPLFGCFPYVCPEPVLGK